MTMQSASPAAALPSAQLVGNAFVEQYYHILHHSPELVYRFYQDSSVLSRPNSNGVMTSVTTMQAINDKILSLDYKNYKAEIKTADAQDSYKEGVIVLVTGCLTGKDNIKKKFTQTFFLAPQERGYFVLNDVFRYVEEIESLETSAVSVNGINDNAPAASLPSGPEPIQVPNHPAPVSAASFEVEILNTREELYDPSDNEGGSTLEEEVVDELPTQSIQNEIIPSVSSDPSAAQEEKKSYASIVKVVKVAKLSTPVYVPTNNVTNRVRMVTASADQSLDSAKFSREPEASAPISDNAHGSENAYEEGHSIYIRNLPSNATVTQLEEEFKKFGPINRGGIQVRSNKQGFCFGFVEFESLISMQNAIKASPLIIGGRQAVVEEKRTTTRVVSSGRGGRYTSGRGGFRSDSFRSDSFRGRGSFGSGRGHSRNEFRNSGDFSGRYKGPSGRNVEEYQRVDRSGSEKFGRQGGVNNSAVPS